MTTYDERLWPPIWLWVVVLLFELSFVVALYAVIDGAWLVLLIALPIALTVWGLAATAARVRVADGLLTAGSATIPVSQLGAVEVLDADQARAVRGPESDPAGYHLIRGWVPAGVRAWVEDPEDRTPYWFIASRRPRALAEAIEAARGQLTGGE